MKRISGVALFSLMLLPLGCGQSPLTKAQEKRFASTMGKIQQSSNTVQATGQQFGGQEQQPQQGEPHPADPQEPQPQAALNAFLMPGFAAKAKDLSPGETQKKMTDIVTKGVSAQDCKMEHPFPSNLSESVSNMDFGKLKGVKFAIEGKNCPINLDLALNVKMGKKQKAAMEASGDFSLTYTVNDEDFKNLADIYGMEAKGTFSGKQEATKTSASSSASMDMSGSLKSVEEDDISFYGRMNSNTSASKDSQSIDVSSTLGMKFDTFTAEIVTTVKWDPKEEEIVKTITLNGEEIDEQDVARLMSGQVREDSEDEESNESNNNGQVAPNPKM